MFDGASGFKEIVGSSHFPVGGADIRRIIDMHLKANPVCHHGQFAIDAVMKLAWTVDKDRSRRVHVEACDVAVRTMANDPSRREPSKRETADHSSPFVVGTVLTTGRRLSEDYRHARLADGSLRAFMPRIEVRSSEEFSSCYPAQMGSRVTIEMINKEKLTAEGIQPVGHADSPMSDAELKNKVKNFRPAAFGDERRAKLVDAAWHLALPEGVGTLIAASCDEQDPAKFKDITTVDCLKRQFVLRLI